MLTAIDLRITTPSLLRIAASLLQDVGRVEPAFEVSAAELAFLVFLIASPLPRFLDFHLVIRKLRRSLHASGYGRSQKVHPRSSGSGREIQTTQLHSTRSVLSHATIPRQSATVQGFRRCSRGETTCKKPRKVIYCRLLGRGINETNTPGTTVDLAIRGQFCRSSVQSFSLFQFHRRKLSEWRSAPRL